MNILLTCGGRRNYLVEYFTAIAGVRIVVCDANIYAPSLYLAHDYFIVPEVYCKDYIPTLFKEAKSRRIDAIIPLNDFELPIMAENRQKFEMEGIRVLVSDLDVIRICFDKYETISFSENLSVSKIPTFFYPEEALEYQKKHSDCSFVIKPRWGTSSAFIEYPQDMDELVYLFNMTKKRLESSSLNHISSIDSDRSIIIQKFINGGEYGMDVINNLDSRFEATLIRKKISMRSGETDKAESVYDDRLNKIGEEIGNKLKHSGILDCDLFIENGEIYLLEMNPRFGGGYPFSHFAGANFPLALVEWLKGNKTPVDCFKYKEGIISSKVDKLVALSVKKNV